MKAYRAQRFAIDQFKGVRMDHATFIDCDFSATDLSGAEFRGCSFHDVQSGKSCNFNSALLKNTLFDRCDLTRCTFRSAIAPALAIVDCRAQEADFRNARFLPIESDGQLLFASRILRSNLSHANFSGVVLDGCHLQGNRWAGAISIGTSFRDALLNDGVFHPFDWSTADFSHADLRGSVLGDLNPREVMLLEVRLDEEQIASMLLRLGIVSPM